MPCLSAAIGPANSAASCRTAAGCHVRQTSSTVGSIAAVPSCPKISRLTMTAASAADATTKRAQASASASAGGASARHTLAPVRWARSAADGGTTTSTSSPRRRRAATNGMSGLKWPSPAVEVTNTRTRLNLICRKPWMSVRWRKIGVNSSATLVAGTIAVSRSVGGSARLTGPLRQPVAHGPQGIALAQIGGDIRVLQPER